MMHFIQVATIDLITPESGLSAAKDFYKNMMKTNMIDLGISGWMADFGEYTPTNARTQ